MSVQTSYAANITNAVAGMVADINTNEIDSYQAEGIIEFGVVVSIGTADGQAAVGIGSGAGKVLGVTVRDLAREGALNTGLINYQDLETLAVMRQGKIFVAIPSGGVAGAALFFTDVTGVIDAGVAGVGETAIAGATLEHDVVAGGIALIRLA